MIERGQLELLCNEIPLSIQDSQSSLTLCSHLVITEHAGSSRGSNLSHYHCYDVVVVVVVVVVSYDSNKDIGENGLHTPVESSEAYSTLKAQGFIVRRASLHSPPHQHFRVFSHLQRRHHHRNSLIPLVHCIPVELKKIRTRYCVRYPEPTHPISPPTLFTSFTSCPTLPRRSKAPKRDSTQATTP